MASERVQQDGNGSRYHQNERLYIGYAVVSSHEVIRAEPLAPHMSVQEADALTEACRVAAGKVANSYTVSNCAWGISHEYCPIWRSRAFLTSAGKPIKKNVELVKQLVEALTLSVQVGIVKVKAHTDGDSVEEKGNRRTDEAAKVAARRPREQWTVAGSQRIPATLSLDVLKSLQLPKQRRNTGRMGAELNSERVWENQDKSYIPRSLLPIMAQATQDAFWIAPGFSYAAAKLVQSCLICAQHNPAAFGGIHTGAGGI
ncbi:unnamed protein product [Ranitomeya imitator]|uniref:RNase H type-1 domain-containing protein n=1 Tax=Ranitomeya imitator TaxID=111125 RepID=A0ABN9KTR0_9NEOB|nr:unnamed protein product [Ranitomeya imitator]